MKQQPLSKKPQGREDREELGALLKLLATLGFTVGGGIAAFFFLGLLAGRHVDVLTEKTGALIGLGIGIPLSLFWAYRTIAAHVERYAPPKKQDPA